jgi:N-acetylmuramoyl-L-alanine amidase
MHQLNLPSPNFGSRDNAAVSMLVLHYTDTKSCKDALDILCDEKAKVSSHYVVDEDGTVYQLVKERDTAWHAGVSYWRGNKNVNNISIGIEIVNPGHRFGYHPFPESQMQAVAELCSGIIARHHILPVNVVGHSDIAPMRKIDPGELFDWKWLAGKGISLWPTPKADARNQAPQVMLAEFGYETPQDDRHLGKIIEAFQRRFRTSLINGKWDNECNQLLAGLLTMI